MSDELLPEMVSLAIKAGRRASYDLLHACDEIADLEKRNFFEERARSWLKIFQFDSGLKDYRHSLHREISVLESRCERLEDLLKSHQIDIEEAL